MNIQTKFNVGDNVCTIDKETMKIREFKIGTIHASVSKSEKPHISYKAEGDSAYADSYEESKCFASEAELMTYITTKAKA